MNKIIRLDYNDPAPDLDIKTVTGDVIRLSSLWAENTLVLAFTRHFG
jgi:peroxiredoxin